MKNSYRLVFAPVVLALASATLGFSAESGYVDFGKLTGPEKGQLVDITLSKGMLKLASFVARCKNAQAGELIAGLSRVRVNVVGLDDTNRETTTGRVTAIRQELVRDGWEQIVAVRGQRQEDVAIYVKQRDGEVIDGLVVTVIDGRKKEAVLVNIVGQIKAEQLAALGEQLDIPHLKPADKVVKAL